MKQLKKKEWSLNGSSSQNNMGRNFKEETAERSKMLYLLWSRVIDIVILARSEAGCYVQLTMPPEVKRVIILHQVPSYAVVKLCLLISLNFKDSSYGLQKEKTIGQQINQSN
ncbi:hypothetical protein Y1Q_0013979 [Alligator mississippiensis]|uniref:Uncharacterized protein n=1 Tax=Alligator mississippiensis TaxID=8496 RepID=A0A151PDK7_ALLMI|nr:hypothetical protein Y1Q_0013979 [Alligator mississippiensis]